MGKIRARAAVEALREYHPPLGRRDGLRLDFNENTQGCSPAVLQALQSITAEQLSRYPEREPVERAVAGFLNLDPSQVLLTNGVDEGIHLICQTFLEAGDKAVIVVPTYAMYEIYINATGAQIIKISSGANFEFPSSEVLAAANSQNVRLIALANPNNPTGAGISTAVLRQLAGALPESVLLVDEAYFEFSGETLIPDLAGLPNVLVARTFSKAFGLAGLRAGLLAGNADLLCLVRRTGSPYSVNAAALTCLPAALNDSAYVQSYVQQVLQGRQRLQAELDLLGIKYWPSRANFVLMEIGADREQFIQRMRAAGILIRDRNSDPGCSGCVRITLGIAAHNEHLFKTLRAVIAKLRSRQSVCDEQ